MCFESLVTHFTVFKFILKFFEIEKHWTIEDRVLIFTISQPPNYTLSTDLIKNCFIEAEKVSDKLQAATVQD